MYFFQVLGIDYSGRFIDAALQFQKKGYLEWTDGEMIEWRLNEQIPRNVVFKQVSSSQS